MFYNMLLVNEMENKTNIDILAKKKEVESQGVHTATQSLITLLNDQGKDKYNVSICKNYKKSNLVIATAIYPKFYIKLKKKKKTIAMVHFLPDTLDGSIKLPKFALNIFKRYVMSFYRKAHDLVTVNPYYVQKLIDLGFDKYHVHSVPNFVSNKKFYPLSVPEKLNFRKKYGIPENSFVVMGCGQTQTRKGVRDFLAVAEDNPDMTFVWVGGFTFGKITEGYKSLKKMISNPPPNVKFLGIIPNEEMNSIYNCADILFMPSYDELFPMTILEASNVNIPILVRDLPLYNPVLFDKVLRGNNNLEFSSILKELVKNPIKRAEAIIKSTELAEMYTADKVYSQWDELIDKLIDDGKEKKRD